MSEMWKDILQTAN